MVMGCRGLASDPRRWLWVSGVWPEALKDGCGCQGSGQRPSKMVVGGRGLAEGPEDGSGWQGSSWPLAPKMVVGDRGPAGQRPLRWLWVIGVQLASGPEDGCG